MARTTQQADAGDLPYRMAFAGGWIDQPFVSRLNPSPPGSMVVVGIQPTHSFMERSGMATGTRRVAARMWGNRIPARSEVDLVRELYAEENKDQPQPSGSQDMIGLIYDGVCRLDYDASHEGGYFPMHIEQCCDEGVARWLERVVHLLPVAPRPPGYDPLGEKHLDPSWVQRLGQTGKDCYDAILAMDSAALGRSVNDCMACWEELLPHVVRHPTLTVDLKGILKGYQERYPGAMFSGCGGGYLYVVSDDSVPGTLRVAVRTGNRR
ncbi:hypothetical protein ACFLSJ_06465 [Verrucomicrobiota bacterium]